MRTADFDYADFQQSQQSRVDEQLLVKFFLKPYEDKEATAAEGRPIYKEREYVEIRVPGKRDPQACRPATNADKARFPKHYEAFLKRVEAPTEGTPLAEWPLCSRTQVEELSFLSCKTVEQLAEMNDNAASQIRGGYDLKNKAREWLEAAEKSKILAEKQQMQDEMDSMRAELDELKALVKKPASRAKKKVVDDEE